MLIHPYLRNALAHDVAAERRRVAERDRRAQPGPLRRGLTRLVARRAVTGRRRAAPGPAEVRIRFATEHDRRTWPELQLHATEHVLVADVDGAPRAALSLVDGAVLAAAEPRRAARRSEPPGAGARGDARPDPPRRVRRARRAR